MWCRLVYCLLYSSLLILQTRCFFFFFQWKVLTGEIFKVVLKANKPFLKNVHVYMFTIFTFTNNEHMDLGVDLLNFLFLLVVVFLRQNLKYVEAAKGLIRPLWGSSVHIEYNEYFLRYFEFGMRFFSLRSDLCSL